MLRRCVPREQAYAEIPPLMKRVAAGTAAAGAPPSADARAAADQVLRIVRPLLAKGALAGRGLLPTSGDTLRGSPRWGIALNPEHSFADLHSPSRGVLGEAHARAGRGSPRVVNEQ